jgi:hypothetical protein
MNNLTNSNEELLPRLVRHLILNASFTSNLGLYHGKMGIVLFFAHYGRFTENCLYDNFAGELLDEIYEDINAGTSINFESGLCGIGWGIEYLLQNGFMEGDSDDVLSEIDMKIMERDIRRITDTSFRTGLKGISCYVQKRINSLCRVQGNRPFDEIYLSDWEEVVSSSVFLDDDRVLSSIIEIPPSRGDILSWDLGLKNGCAGYGLGLII